VGISKITLMGRKTTTTKTITQTGIIRAISITEEVHITIMEAGVQVSILMETQLDMVMEVKTKEETIIIIMVM
jgi:hypothetical protein